MTATPLPPPLLSTPQKFTRINSYSSDIIPHILLLRHKRSRAHELAREELGSRAGVNTLPRTTSRTRSLSPEKKRRRRLPLSP